MYSQNNEEKFIIDYFKNKPSGKFIDVGAFHPFKFSNTRKLIEIGWHGVCVEPSPKCFANFITEYSENHNIVLLNVGLAEASGEFDFYEANGDAISTTVLSHKAKWEAAGVNYTPIKVPMVAVGEFEKSYCQDADFLNIDVESSNYEIFSLFSDLFLSSLRMICIEHDNRFEEIRNRMFMLGFSEIAINGENIILAKV
jgi:FkbM family methyltransferase